MAIGCASFSSLFLVIFYTIVPGIRFPLLTNLPIKGVGVEE
ncbi:hypothetical protein QY97_02938 [Bacillus thermotolerans]|uniref:Uncharacterized protein n=1 Tax=Bacillus thermotolerans TaxID=1221996 RepID=A0A0F5HV69_BACTR|nr:hypothetical protein QY97_02938 [Bacillus thermotolerans]KKB36742.1 hypothetical protein QY95_03010 [Bacillus thermotolerans]KKB44773.1 hypothetical protein QY96_01054 [Bacillus thermotolerans]